MTLILSDLFRYVDHMENSADQVRVLHTIGSLPQELQDLRSLLRQVVILLSTGENVPVFSEEVPF